MFVVLSLPTYGYGQELPAKTGAAAGTKAPQDSLKPAEIAQEALGDQKEKYQKQLQGFIQPYMMYFDTKIKELKTLKGKSVSAEPGKDPVTAQAKAKPEIESGKKALPGGPQSPSSGSDLVARFVAFAEGLIQYLEKSVAAWLG